MAGGLATSLGGSLGDFARDLMPEVFVKHWRLDVTSAEPEEIDRSIAAGPPLPPPGLAERRRSS